VIVEIGKGNSEDESKWIVNKIGEETSKQEVLTTMTECLTAVFGVNGDMLNAWVEDDKRVRMIVPAALLKVT
jgi:hypothetical protein